MTYLEAFVYCWSAVCFAYGLSHMTIFNYQRNSKYKSQDVSSGGRNAIFSLTDERKGSE